MLSNHDHGISLPEGALSNANGAQALEHRDVVVSLYGHVTPAAGVTLRPEDADLGFDLPDGTRLSRCLRCDAWVHTAAPDRPAPNLPADLPRPLRGRALDELVIIRAIALERGSHVVFFLLVAMRLVLLQIGLPSLQHDAQTILPLLDQTRSGEQLLSRWLDKLINLSGGRVWILALMSLAYAVLEGVESVFLWRGKRWAEYLTVIATSLFLPLEINELIDKVSFLRVAALLVNLAILGYLVWTKRLFGVRGGHAGLERELAADVDWPRIHAQAPVSAVREEAGGRR